MELHTDKQSRKSYEKVGRLYRAIKEQMSIEVIQNLLQTEGDINYEIPKHLGPNLLFSSYSMEPAILRLLLDAGADFTKKNDEGRTTVHEIIRAEKKKLSHSIGIFKNDFLDTVLCAHEKFNNPSNPCDGSGISHLHAACMTNNASVVEFFLKNGVDVDLAIKVDSYIFPLYTPLHLAAKFGCAESLEVLLKYGANVFSKNADGMSPLHLLVEIYTNDLTSEELPQYEGTLNIFLKFLISDSSNFNASDEFGFCKFHVACLLQDLSAVESVLELVTDINQPVNNESPVCPGFTALHFAAFSNVQIFKLLLENGADIEAKSAIGQTPFDLCLRKYSVTDIHSIISTKREWRNIVLSNGKIKLTNVIAAMENSEDFSLFLDRSRLATTLCVPRDSPLWPGYTLLHLAVVFTKELPIYEHIYQRERHDNSKIDACLKQGADMTIAEAKGSTALHLAFYMEKTCVVQCLLDQHNQTVNPVGKGNLSHFHIACAAGHLQAVEHFLSLGVDVNSPVRSTFKWYMSTSVAGYLNRHFFICPGSTALHINAASCGVEVTKQLLKHGADVHAQDSNGFTPIHRLLSPRIDNHYDGHSSVLLSVKNLKNIVTNCGLSHLHVACLYNHTKAVEKLLIHGADSNAPLTGEYDENFEQLKYGDPRKPLAFLSRFAGYTPLHFSREIFHDCDFDFMLIERGADVFAKNGKGISVLQLMLQKLDTHYCQNFCYEEFNENDFIQANLEEEFGITKLHLAILMDDPSLAKSLIKRGANVNAKIYSNSPIWPGRTPLHCAVKRVFEECYRKKVFRRLEKIVRLLIKKGADLYSMDDNGDTPFHFFEQTRFSSRDALFFVSILFENLKTFNANPTNRNGLSLFHIACRTSNLTIIKKFLSHGVDVNQPISHFSNWHPGSTSLHLFLHYYPELKVSWFSCDSSDKGFLEIIDMFLRNGADVNATDAIGETPIFKVIALRGSTELEKNRIRFNKLRWILIERFISNGANVHVTHIKGVSPFEHLLSYDDTMWEEIEVFLKSGCQFDTYNPISKEGYLARVFRFQRTYIPPENTIIKNQVWLMLINSPNITKINDRGRTAIHNVVSIRADDERERSDSTYLLGISTTYVEFHTELIMLLSVQGCDIDHQDFEGKTALHLAVAFKNNRAIMGLLNNGADINLTDKDGKTAFAYCYESMTTFNYPTDIEALIAIDFDDNYAVKAFAMHVCKLEFCLLPVNQQNKQLKTDVVKVHRLVAEAFDPFCDEIEKTKSIKIGASSLYEFLMNPDADTVYTNMTSEERREVDQVFKNIDKYKFLEIGCLLKVRYRQTIERIKLVEPALESLNLLTKNQLPDLCCRHILKFLKNEDVKRLIASMMSKFL